MNWVIQRFLDRVVAEVEAQVPASVVDLGCGEGIVAERLAALPAPPAYRGLELNPVALAEARKRLPGLTFEGADLLKRLPIAGERADLALCLEVVEHLDDPDLGVRRIADWTQRVAIISVPWEPYFRMGNFLRGKYVSRWGNHPEHVQQFGVSSFSKLLRKHFPQVQVETCFPWLIATCRKNVF